MLFWFNLSLYHLKEDAEVVLLAAQLGERHGEAAADAAARTLAQAFGTFWNKQGQVVAVEYE